MSAEVSAIMDNIVTTIEGVTADTALGGKRVFRHIAGIYEADEISTRSSVTRRFHVEDTGERDRGEIMGQTYSPFDLLRSFTVTVAYRMSQDAYGLSKVVAEDMDRLLYELERNDGNRWNAAATTIFDRQVGSYVKELDRDTGGILLVSFDVEVRYRPDYSGG